MGTIPTDVIPLIAAGAPVIFLTCRRFAALLQCPHVKYDTMIAVGYDIIISKNGITWLKNGRFHRCDGPTHEGDWIGNGYITIWYKNGDRHRIGGPAVISTDTTIWCKDGVIHREDGPAVIREDGTQLYYYEGNRYNEQIFNIMMASRQFIEKLRKLFT